ncbi:MAG: sigma-70 family RNA polymerase sigma factor [Chloroflexi bacterium]|nr:sigma-70 family RNA polymerase sigma factor [Chloroflexota bacterium]
MDWITMDDLYRSGDTSIERAKDALIRSTEDPAFRKKAYQRAYQLAGNKDDAEDYLQEALKRFISAIKDKTSLEEIKRIKQDPLPYVYVTLRNIHTDVLRKKHIPVPQAKRSQKMHQTQKDASEKLGRQKRELLAAQTGMLVEDIANREQEEGRIGSTRLGVEEQVVSEMFVEAFINSLPVELRELARLLIIEDYHLNELSQRLKRSYEELKDQKKRIREAFRAFQQQQTQLEEVRSTYGR